MTIPDLSRARWRTSSYSSGNGQCVEVGSAGPAIAVRDSKDPERPVLTSGPGEWRRFATRLKAG